MKLTDWSAASKESVGVELTDFGAARRIPLAGRHGLLQEASRGLRSGGVHLLYFEGEGGIGKTALLEAILDRSVGGDRADFPHKCTVADTTIDLYHVDVHTPEGLIRRITQVLGSQLFRETSKILNALDRARRLGNVDVVTWKSIALHRSFLEEFGTLAQERVVLAFDSLEALGCEQDPSQAELDEKVPILSVGEWLFETFLPALHGNVLILMAGRPLVSDRGGIGERLHALSKPNPNFQLRHLTVEALQEEETVEYLKTLSRLEGDRGDADAAMRLWNLAEKRGEVVHFLTGGRPTLLALVADIVAHGWMLPLPFGRTLEELWQREPEAWRQEIEWALVARIQESPTPIGDAVRALAWLRKGATPELLARVMDLTSADGKRDLETAEQYLEQVARLALVKVRSGDGRIFLYDEFYALLDQYVLRESSQEERDRVYQAVLLYYDELTTELEQRVARSSFILPLGHARLRQAYLELMHYQLCYRPPLGFAMYFCLAEEALGGRDADIDLLLRTELLHTVRWLEGTASLAGLDLQEVELDTAVRWGMRALCLHNNPERALDIFERIQQRKAPENLGLAGVHIQLYQAAARIERALQGDWQQARALLHSVQQKTDKMLASQDTRGPATPSPIRSPFWRAQTPHTSTEASVAEGQLWRAKALRTLALNQQASLDQKQGRYAEAVAYYQASAVLQRQMSSPPQQMADSLSLPKSIVAPTLSNLSYAMALLGQCEDARLVAQEAQRWAHCSGKDYVLAWALMARALVEGYDNHPREALHYAGAALKIAEPLHTSHIRGRIYLTRTRAHRYLLLSDEGRHCEAQRLEEITEEANRAASLLKNNPPDRVSALIERGCLFREIARRQYSQQNGVEAVRSVRKSQRDLESAATLAGAVGLPDKHALAWTHLAWLWYYTGEIEEAYGALQRAHSAIPRDYILPSLSTAEGPGQSALPPVARDTRRGEACLPFWSTLSKVEMLKAFIALDQAQAASSREAQEGTLRGAVKHMVSSLAYSEQIADGHFDMMRAEANLHRRILQDGLSIASLRECARQVAEGQGLRQPTSFQRFLDRMFGPAHLWA